MITHDSGGCYKNLVNITVEKSKINGGNTEAESFRPLFSRSSRDQEKMCVTASSSV